MEVRFKGENSRVATGVSSTSPRFLQLDLHLAALRSPVYTSHTQPNEYSEERFVSVQLQDETKPGDRDNTVGAYPAWTTCFD